ncbi:MAG TPA: YhcH/YjgK/YiaL family protein [Patescibacteria group bacterium]|nr:YhcH/YjgK/YiaL family protein [Patescibacteria group bacterium]
MILDRVNQIQKYKGLSRKIEAAIDFIEKMEGKELSKGRIDIEDGIFAMISEYKTIGNADKKWEAHRKYIDLQYMLWGSEIMGYQNIEKMKDSFGYKEADDIEFFNYQGSYSELVVETGMFAIFFPEDAHAPCVFNKDLEVKKVVVKIPV